ncbi:MAG TPA: phosphoadenylyl-sulfate reductase [Longimicrobiales bacterium]|nr:phosphoadenylyl-sulfate reductase [Longimicrobiales bacterium]
MLPLIAFGEQQLPVDGDFDLDGAEPADIIRWAVDTVGRDRLIVSTSFGPSGMVNLHLLSEIAPEVPVVFIDTLYHFPETLEMADKVRERYGLDVRVYRAAASREEFERLHGERLWERDLDLFHKLTKVEPMERALEGVDGWITGRRRDQAATRAQLKHVERGQRIKVNPLAAWTRRDVWSFIYRNDVPYNPLHDRGYASIGEAPLTTPVLEGEDERAGRWRGQGRLECGLHQLK